MEKTKGITDLHTAPPPNPRLLAYSRFFKRGKVKKTTLLETDLPSKVEVSFRDAWWLENINPCRKFFIGVVTLVILFHLLQTTKHCQKMPDSILFSRCTKVLEDLIKSQTNLWNFIIGFNSNRMRPMPCHSASPPKYYTALTTMLNRTEGRPDWEEAMPQSTVEDVMSLKNASERKLGSKVLLLTTRHGLKYMGSQN